MKVKPILVVAALAALVASAPGLAQDKSASAVDTGGFYGGVALRSSGLDEGGVNFGHLKSAWGHFSSPVSDDTTNRALLYGGYRFANDIAVEGSLATADRYALRPVGAAGPGGIGLTLSSSAAGMPARTWNADVYTSWSFRKAFALYGRLGYAQSDNVPAYALATLPVSDARRLRDGMNYGVGVRYDFSSALGLRLEYARFSRFAGEAVTGPLPESDQVQLGMQFRF